MRADLLQAVSLGCHGNLFLAAPGEKAPELLHSNISFRGISEVTFERGSEGLMKGRIAENIAPWLKRVTREGATKFRLIIDDLEISPRTAPKIWGLMSDGDIGMEIWTPTWSPKAMNIGEPKACRVLFTAYRSTRFFLKPVTLLKDEILEIEQELGIVAGALAAILPEHANRVIGAFQQFMVGDNEAEGLEACFPAQMDREPKGVGVLGIRLCKMVSAADWDTGLSRRAAGDKLDAFTKQIWKLGLKCLESAVYHAIPAPVEEKVEVEIG